MKGLEKGVYPNEIVRLAVEELLQIQKWPPNFRWEEFPVSGGKWQMLPADKKLALKIVRNCCRTAWMLEAVRFGCSMLKRTECPVSILSGYRNAEYNLKLGREPTSQHPIGTAADVKVARADIYEVKFIACELQENGLIPQGGVGLYVGLGMNHLDIRGHKARWEE